MQEPKPYVYKVTFASGEFYYGCRWANKKPAEQDLGFIYKTSSKKVKEKLKESGYENCLWEIIEQCETKEEVLDSEQILIWDNKDNTMLLNGNVINPYTRKTRFLCDVSGENNPMFGLKGELHPAFGRKHTVAELEKISGPNNWMYGNGSLVSGENNPMFGKDRSGTNNPRFGAKWSEEWKEEQAKRFTGRKHSLSSKVHSPEFAEQMRKSRQGNKCYAYDHTIYHFIHKDGREEFCTRHELLTKYNLPQTLHSVINRKPKYKSCKGWSVVF